MAATLFLVRHAAHIHLNLRLSGRLADIPLSEAGRQQASALAIRLSRASLRHVFCSPLDRTRETADAIAAACGIGPAEVAEPLMEIDMGDWTGRAFDTFGDDPAWRAWNEQRGTARIPGGETMAEAQARIVGFMTEVAARHDGQAVALVSHADMIKAAVCHVLNLSLDDVGRFDIDPASVTQVVLGDWGGRVMRLNEGVE
ncbi:probable phosphoglycerate mutase [Sphingomonas gellani]|uniref:Probable phosphoglycerate mutase n=1 Tax=Sphingomonas gellani TaxID=1166340 RepID=A0A1H7ZHI5_9SPHN|nr:histidine phosphatase family protein [Sphingomonas gellani]SEM57796.1 probable phosphoglycerate mutase [Sphingomonas gellani]